MPDKSKRGRYRGLTHYDRGFLRGFTLYSLEWYMSSGPNAPTGSKAYFQGIRAGSNAASEAWEKLEANPPHTGIIWLWDGTSGYRYASMSLSDAVSLTSR